MRAMITPNTPFIADNWQAILISNGLDSFEALWQTHTNLVDKPNYDHKGHSCIGTYTLIMPHGEPCLVYIKKQQDYFVHRWCQGWLRFLPACVAEFYALMQYKQLQVASLMPIYCGKARMFGSTRAILITRALDNYLDIDAWRQQVNPTVQQRRAMISEVAKTIRRLHGHGFMHYSLYPKHIFVSTTADKPTICLIDLEKTRRFWWRWQAIKRDLATLYHRAHGWNLRDAWCFMQAYAGEDAKKIWRRLVRAA